MLVICPLLYRRQLQSIFETQAMRTLGILKKLQFFCFNFRAGMFLPVETVCGVDLPELISRPKDHFDSKDHACSAFLSLKVGSRRVIQVSAFIMLLFGVLTKLMAVFVTIPPAILGAMYITLFGL